MGAPQCKDSFTRILSCISPPGNKVLQCTTHVEKFLFYSQPCSLFSALKTTLVTIIFQYLPSVLLTISKNKPILLLNSIAIFWSQYQQNKNTFGYTITIFKCMYHIKLYESLYHSLKSTKILITLEALLNSL